MEIRKVQMTGGATYIVSLPKGWARENGVKSGTQVSIVPQEDGGLLIFPSVRMVEERRGVLDVSGTKGEHIFRMLVGMYIKGYRHIIIEGGITDRVRREADEFVRATIGPEIIEEDENRMVLKDLLSPDEVPMLRSVRRMHMLARGMYFDAMAALRKRDRGRALEIVKQDSSLDRLYWLLARQYNLLLVDPVLGRALRVGRDEALTLLHVGRYLERIGDHMCRICTRIPRRTRGADGMLARMDAVGVECMALLDSAMGSIYTEDVNQANHSIDQGDMILGSIDALRGDIARLERSTAVSLNGVMDSLRRVVMYSRDIAECIINQLA